ncbi:MAG: hypothetical protein ACPKOI_11375 [Pleomorphochaeta sp.]
MGKFNSSATRVNPLFDFINCNPLKMNELFSLFNIDNSETFKEINNCYYGDNEKGLPPTKKMLMWYLDNLDKLTIPNTMVYHFPHQLMNIEKYYFPMI